MFHRVASNSRVAARIGSVSRALSARAASGSVSRLSSRGAAAETEQRPNTHTHTHGSAAAPAVATLTNKTQPRMRHAPAPQRNSLRNFGTLPLAPAEWRGRSREEKEITLMSPPRRGMATQGRHDNTNPVCDRDSRVTDTEVTRPNSTASSTHSATQSSTKSTKSSKTTKSGPRAPGGRTTLSGPSIAAGGGPMWDAAQRQAARERDEHVKLANHAQAHSPWVSEENQTQQSTQRVGAAMGGTRQTDRPGTANAQPSFAPGTDHLVRDMRADKSTDSQTAQPPTSPRPRAQTLNTPQRNMATQREGVSQGYARVSTPESSKASQNTRKQQTERHERNLNAGELDRGEAVYTSSSFAESSPGQRSDELPAWVTQPYVDDFQRKAMEDRRSGAAAREEGLSGADIRMDARTGRSVSHRSQTARHMAEMEDERILSRLRAMRSGGASREAAQETHAENKSDTMRAGGRDGSGGVGGGITGEVESGESRGGMAERFVVETAAKPKPIRGNIPDRTVTARTVATHSPAPDRPNAAEIADDMKGSSPLLRDASHVDTRSTQHEMGYHVPHTAAHQHGHMSTTSFPTSPARVATAKQPYVEADSQYSFREAARDVKQGVQAAAASIANTLQSTLPEDINRRVDLDDATASGRSMVGRGPASTATTAGASVGRTAGMSASEIRQAASMEGLTTSERVNANSGGIGFDLTDMRQDVRASFREAREGLREMVDEMRKGSSGERLNARNIYNEEEDTRTASWPDAFTAASAQSAMPSATSRYRSATPFTSAASVGPSGEPIEVRPGLETADPLNPIYEDNIPAFVRTREGVVSPAFTREQLEPGPADNYRRARRASEYATADANVASRGQRNANAQRGGEEREAPLFIDVTTLRADPVASMEAAENNQWRSGIPQAATAAAHSGRGATASHSAGAASAHSGAGQSMTGGTSGSGASTTAAGAASRTESGDRFQEQAERLRQEAIHHARQGDEGLLRDVEEGERASQRSSPGAAMQTSMAPSDMSKGKKKKKKGPREHTSLTGSGLGATPGFSIPAEVLGTPTVARVADGVTQGQAGQTSTGAAHAGQDTSTTTATSTSARHGIDTNDAPLTGMSEAQGPTTAAGRSRSPGQSTGTSNGSMRAMNAYTSAFTGPVHDPRSDPSKSNNGGSRSLSTMHGSSNNSSGGAWTGTTAGRQGATGQRGQGATGASRSVLDDGLDLHDPANPIYEDNIPRFEHTEDKTMSGVLNPEQVASAPVADDEPRIRGYSNLHADRRNANAGVSMDQAEIRGVQRASAQVAEQREGREREPWVHGREGESAMGRSMAGPSSSAGQTQTASAATATHGPRSHTGPLAAAAAAAQAGVLSAEQAANAAAEAARQAASAAVGTVKEKVMSSAQSAKKTVTDELHKLEEFATTAAQKARQGVDTVEDISVIAAANARRAATKAHTGVATGVKETLHAAEDVAKVVSTAAHMAEGAVEGATAGVAAPAKEAVEAVAQRTERVVGEAAARAARSMAGVANGAKDLKEGLRDAARSIREVASKGMREASQGVRDAAHDVRDATSHGMREASHGIREAAHSVRDVASQGAREASHSMRDVAHGVRDAASHLGTAARGAAATAAEAATGAGHTGTRSARSLLNEGLDQHDIANPIYEDNIARFEDAPGAAPSGVLNEEQATPAAASGSSTRFSGMSGTSGTSAATQASRGAGAGSASVLNAGLDTHDPANPIYEDNIARFEDAPGTTPSGVLSEKQITPKHTHVSSRSAATLERMRQAAQSEPVSSSTQTSHHPASSSSSHSAATSAQRVATSPIASNTDAHAFRDTRAMDLGTTAANPMNLHSSLSGTSTSASQQQRQQQHSGHHPQQALPERHGGQSQAEKSPLVSAAAATPMAERRVKMEQEDPVDIVAKIAHVDGKDISQRRGETPSSAYTSVPSGGAPPSRVMNMASMTPDTADVADVEELEFAPNIPGHTYGNKAEKPRVGNYNSHEYDRRVDVVSSDLGGAVETADGHIDHTSLMPEHTKWDRNVADMVANPPGYTKTGDRRSSPARPDIPLRASAEYRSDLHDIEDRWITGKAESEVYRHRAKEREREDATAGHFRRDRKPKSATPFPENAFEVETGVQGQVFGTASAAGRPTENVRPPPGLRDGGRALSSWAKAAAAVDASLQAPMPRGSDAAGGSSGARRMSTHARSNAPMQNDASDRPITREPEQYEASADADAEGPLATSHHMRRRYWGREGEGEGAWPERDRSRYDLSAVAQQNTELEMDYRRRRSLATEQHDPLLRRLVWQHEERVLDETTAVNFHNDTVERQNMRIRSAADGRGYERLPGPNSNSQYYPRDGLSPRLSLTNPPMRRLHQMRGLAADSQPIGASRSRSSVADRMVPLSRSSIHTRAKSADAITHERCVPKPASAAAAKATATASPTAAAAQAGPQVTTVHARDMPPPRGTGKLLIDDMDVDASTGPDFAHPEFAHHVSGQKSSDTDTRSSMQTASATGQNRAQSAAAGRRSSATHASDTHGNASTASSSTATAPSPLLAGLKRHDTSAKSRSSRAASARAHGRRGNPRSFSTGAGAGPSRPAPFTEASKRPAYPTSSSEPSSANPTTDGSAITEATSATSRGGSSKHTHHTEDPRECAAALAEVRDRSSPLPIAKNKNPSPRALRRNWGTSVVGERVFEADYPDAAIGRLAKTNAYLDADQRENDEGVQREDLEEPLRATGATDASKQRVSATAQSRQSEPRNSELSAADDAEWQAAMAKHAAAISRAKDTHAQQRRAIADLPEITRYEDEQEEEAEEQRAIARAREKAQSHGDIPEGMTANEQVVDRWVRGDRSSTSDRQMSPQSSHARTAAAHPATHASEPIMGTRDKPHTHISTLVQPSRQPRGAPGASRTNTASAGAVSHEDFSHDTSTATATAAAAAHASNSTSHVTLGRLRTGQADVRRLAGHVTMSGIDDCDLEEERHSPGSMHGAGLFLSHSAYQDAQQAAMRARRDVRRLVFHGPREDFVVTRTSNRGMATSRIATSVPETSDSGAQSSSAPTSPASTNKQPSPETTAASATPSTSVAAGQSTNSGASVSRPDTDNVQPTRRPIASPTGSPAATAAASGMTPASNTPVAGAGVPGASAVPTREVPVARGGGVAGGSTAGRGLSNMGQDVESSRSGAETIDIANTSGQQRRGMHTSRAVMAPASGVGGTVGAGTAAAPAGAPAASSSAGALSSATAEPPSAAELAQDLPPFDAYAQVAEDETLSAAEILTRKNEIFEREHPDLPKPARVGEMLFEYSTLRASHPDQLRNPNLVGLAGRREYKFAKQRPQRPPRALWDIEETPEERAARHARERAEDEEQLGATSSSTTTVIPQTSARVDGSATTRSYSTATKFAFRVPGRHNVAMYTVSVVPRGKAFGTATRTHTRLSGPFARAALVAGVFSRGLATISGFSSMQSGNAPRTVTRKVRVAQSNWDGSTTVEEEEVEMVEDADNQASVASNDASSRSAAASSRADTGNTKSALSQPLQSSTMASGNARGSATLTSHDAASVSPRNFATDSRNSATAPMQSGTAPRTVTRKVRVAQSNWDGSTTVEEEEVEMQVSEDEGRGATVMSSNAATRPATDSARTAAAQTPRSNSNPTTTSSTRSFSTATNRNNAISVGTRNFATDSRDAAMSSMQSGNAPRTVTRKVRVAQSNWDGSTTVEEEEVEMVEDANTNVTVASNDAHAQMSSTQMYNGASDARTHAAQTTSRTSPNTPGNNTRSFSTDSRDGSSPSMHAGTAARTGKRTVRTTQSSRGSTMDEDLEEYEASGAGDPDGPRGLAVCGSGPIFDTTSGEFSNKIGPDILGDKVHEQRDDLRTAAQRPHYESTTMAKSAPSTAPKRAGAAALDYPNNDDEGTNGLSPSERAARNRLLRKEVPPVASTASMTQEVSEEVADPRGPHSSTGYNSSLRYEGVQEMEAYQGSAGPFASTASRSVPPRGNPTNPSRRSIHTRAPAADRRAPGLRVAKAHYGSGAGAIHKPGPSMDPTQTQDAQGGSRGDAAKAKLQTASGAEAARGAGGAASGSRSKPGAASSDTSSARAASSSSDSNDSTSVPATEKVGMACPLIKRKDKEHRRAEMPHTTPVPDGEAATASTSSSAIPSHAQSTSASSSASNTMDTAGASANRGPSAAPQSGKPSSTYRASSASNAARNASASSSSAQPATAAASNTRAAASSSASSSRGGSTAPSMAHTQDNTSSTATTTSTSPSSSSASPSMTSAECRAWGVSYGTDNPCSLPGEPVVFPAGQQQGMHENDMMRQRNMEQCKTDPSVCTGFTTGEPRPSMSSAQDSSSRGSQAEQQSDKASMSQNTHRQRQAESQAPREGLNSTSGESGSEPVNLSGVGAISGSSSSRGSMGGSASGMRAVAGEKASTSRASKLNLNASECRPEYRMPNPLNASSSEGDDYSAYAQDTVAGFSMAHEMTQKNRAGRQGKSTVSTSSSTTTGNASSTTPNSSRSYSTCARRPTLTTIARQLHSLRSTMRLLAGSMAQNGSREKYTLTGHNVSDKIYVSSKDAAFDTVCLHRALTGAEDGQPCGAINKVASGCGSHSIANKHGCLGQEGSVKLAGPGRAGGARHHYHTVTGAGRGAGVASGSLLTLPNRILKR